MPTELDLFEKILVGLWAECGPDVIAWSTKIDDATWELYDLAPDVFELSLRLLLGLDEDDKEISWGDVRVFAPGVIFFSDVGDMGGRGYNSGLVRRQSAPTPTFFVQSIIKPERSINITGCEDGTARMCMVWPDGSWELTIPAERWSILLAWFDFWLPVTERVTSMPFVDPDPNVVQKALNCGCAQVLAVQQAQPCRHNDGRYPRTELDLEQVRCGCEEDSHCDRCNGHGCVWKKRFRA